MDNLVKTEQLMKAGQFKNNPHACAEYKAMLAAEYSFYTGQLEDILVRKPEVWNDLRKECESDKAAERKWESSKDGIDEMGLRLRLKRIDKLSGALSTLIRIAEGEAKNQF